MSCNELEKKVSELKSLLSFRMEVEEQIKELENSIKNYMTVTNTDELRAGVYIVKWKPVTSQRFNTKAFKADFPDIYSAYQNAATCRRFTVS